MQSPFGAINVLGVTARLITRFLSPRTGPRMEIQETSKLLKTMVPPLHQTNVYINRQLWVWRAQNCNRLLGAINALGVTAGLKNPVSYTAYRADIGNLGNFKAVENNGTAFPPKQCSYQKVAVNIEAVENNGTAFAPKQCFYIKRQLWV